MDQKQYTYPSWLDHHNNLSSIIGYLTSPGRGDTPRALLRIYSLSTTGMRGGLGKVVWWGGGVASLKQPY